MMRNGKLLVGLCGNKGCGKDTIADVLCNNHGYVKISFAEAVYERASELLGVPVDYLQRRDIKEQTGWSLLNPFNRKAKNLSWKERISLAFALKDKSPRQWVQQVGEDAKATDPLIWVKITERKISNLRKQGQKKIVVTDIRFDYEHRMLKRLGAGIFRITRQEADAAALNNPDLHISEDWLRNIARKDPSIRVIANNHLAILAADDIKRQLFHC